MMILGEEQISALKTLKEYAIANPYLMDDLLDIMNGQKPMPGLVDERCCFLPVGVKVVFCHELQTVGEVRHLSKSVHGKLPSPAAVIGVMKILGFEGGFESCKIEVEKLLDKGEAISLAQKVKL